MIADSAPVDGFKGSRGGVDVKLAALAGFFRWFAQGLAIEREAVRSVHEAVEDGIGDCRIDDHLVPVIDGELTGDDGGAAAVAIIDDFEQIAALLRGQRCQPPVVEDQKLAALVLRSSTVAFCLRLANLSRVT